MDLGEFNQKLKNLYNNPGAAWNQAVKGADDFGLQMIELKPGAGNNLNTALRGSLGTGSGFTNTQRFGAGFKSGINLGGLGGVANIAGAGFAGYGGYQDARAREEEVDDALVRGIGEGAGSFGGAAVGMGIGAMTGPLAPVAIPLLGWGGSVIGQKIGGGLSEVAYDFTPWGERALSPEELLAKREDEAFNKQLDRMNQIGNAQFELAKQGALFEEEIAQRAAQDRYEKQLNLESLNNIALQQRELFSDSIASFDNNNAANKQFLLGLYG